MEKFMNKTCPRCNQVKDVSEFGKDKQKSDGLYTYCRLCASAKTITFRYSERGREYTKHYRLTPTYQAKKRRYELSANGKAARDERQRIDMLKHPEQWKARHAVNNAVRDGKIPPAKELLCAHVDNNCKGQVEYHHHRGYSDEHKFDVLPLCRYHHRLADRAANDFQKSRLEPR